MSYYKSQSFLIFKGNYGKTIEKKILASKLN